MIGQRIKELLTERGWRACQLANFSGVSEGNISALITRNSVMSKHAPALAKAFGVPLEALLNKPEQEEGPSTTTPPTEVPGEGISSSQHQALGATSALPARDAKMVEVSFAEAQLLRYFRGLTQEHRDDLMHDAHRTFMRDSRDRPATEEPMRLVDRRRNESELATNERDFLKMIDRRTRS